MMINPQTISSLSLILCLTFNGDSSVFTSAFTRPSSPSVIPSSSRNTLNNIVSNNAWQSSSSSPTIGRQNVQLTLSSPEQREMESEETMSEHELASLDLSKTIYISSMKSPKDAYVSFAEKGKANAKMAKRKIFHQSVLGGCYVGFGALLSLSVAGNMGGIAAANPGLQKMMFAALFPVNLLLIVSTGGQLFTGNSATCAAARYEGLIDNYELIRNWGVSIAGNVVGCALMAFVASYVGLLTGGTAALCTNTALAKCSYSISQNFVKAILCNWMVTIAVFLAGASNDLVGKLVGVWFPISTFVAIGLEHSVANMFLLPAALLLKAPISIMDVVFKNIVPVLLGNAVAGAIVVAGSYSYQFGQLGGKRRAIFAEQLAKRELNKRKAEIKRRENDSSRIIAKQSANGST